MSERKTPILLRRAPLSGDVMALYRYRRKEVLGRDVIDASGKQPVTGDFEALMLQYLMDDGAENIVAILDGAAGGDQLNDAERAEVRVLRERIKACERHNERIDSGVVGEVSGSAGGSV